MKRFQVLALVGGILLLIGIGVAVGALVNSSGSVSRDLPGNSLSYLFIQFSGFAGENVSAQFTVNMGTVDGYILDQSAYNSYSYNFSVPSSLASAHGSAGTLQAVLPSSGTFYIVFNHGSGYSTTIQGVSVNYQYSGFNVTTFGVGVFVLALGVLVIVLAMRSKRKQVSRLPLQAVPTDVTMFQPPQPPQPPPPPPSPPSG